jgi:hypothetical protein
MGTFIAKFQSSFFLENPEKKWHRSVKLDKNKCPIFKSARRIMQKTPSKT